MVVTQCIYAFIYWDFSNQSSLGFTETYNGVCKKNKQTQSVHKVRYVQLIKAFNGGHSEVNELSTKGTISSIFI